MSLRELTAAWQEELSLVEAIYRRMWEGRIALAALAHAMGGLGIGLLVPRGVAAGVRNGAYLLVGVSLAIHLYALLTPRARERQSRIWESMTETGED